MSSISPEPASPNRLSRVRQMALVAVAAVALLLVVVISRLFHAQQPDPAEPPATQGVFQATPDQFAGLQIQTVKASPAASFVRATGIITTDDDHSTPVLPPLTGQITDVLVEAGQTVTRGQALAIVRSTERSQVRDTLVTASAQRDTARSQLQIARNNAHRQEMIFRNGGGAQRDYQQAQTDLIAAQATLRTAEAAYAAAEDQVRIQGGTPAELSRLGTSDGDALATIRAPISGVIASRAVSVGQFLTSNADTPIFVITDPATVWLVAQVTEADATHIHVNDTLDVTTPSSPGRVFSTKVSMVGAGLDPVTHRLPVRAVIDNPGGVLKPQMFANFVIRTVDADPQAPAVITVPAAAVIREGDDARVWIAEPGNRLVARPVQIADGPDEDSVIVTSGLKPGEQIVTRGALFVNEAGIPG